MTATSPDAFATCLAFTLGPSIEGGYQCAANDPGNWTGGRVGLGELAGTNHGVSAAAWREWRGGAVTKADMQAITLASATPFYAARYWNPILGDRLPAGVCLSAFDMQVNAGTNGGRCLQRAAGLAGDAVDGWIGPQTLAAIDALDADHAARLLTPGALGLVQGALGLTPDEILGRKTLLALAGALGRAVALCGRFYDERMRVYRASALWASDGAGWATRAATCLRASIAMASAAVAPAG